MQRLETNVILSNSNTCLYPMIRVGGWKHPLHPVLWEGDQHQPPPHPSLPHAGVLVRGFVLHPIGVRAAGQRETDEWGDPPSTTRLQPSWHTDDRHRPAGETNCYSGAEWVGGYRSLGRLNDAREKKKERESLKVEECCILCLLINKLVSCWNPILFSKEELP